MKTYRWVAGAALTALVATGLATAPATAGTSESPTGAFQVMYGTTDYIYQRALDHSGPSAHFILYRSALGDDTTRPENLVVRLYAGTDIGDSTNGAVWDYGSSTKILEYGSDTYDPAAPPPQLAGTYHPYVTITDEDGNTTTVQLPAVTLVPDHTPPVVRLTPPRAGIRKTIRAWRHVRGTTIDAGISRPDGPFAILPQTDLLILQKRGPFFYVYSSSRKRWSVGERTVAATVSSATSDAFAYNVGRRGWRTQFVHGLTRGRLVVLASATDELVNETPWTVLTRVSLTRRR